MLNVLHIIRPKMGKCSSRHQKMNDKKKHFLKFEVNSKYAMINEMIQTNRNDNC